MLQQEERERAEGSWFVSKAYYDNDWLTFEMHICLFFMALEVLPAFVRTLLKGIWIFFSVIVAFFVDLLHVFVATRLVRIVFDGI